MKLSEYIYLDGYDLGYSVSRIVTLVEIWRYPLSREFIEILVACIKADMFLFGESKEAAMDGLMIPADMRPEILKALESGPGESTCDLPAGIDFEKLEKENGFGGALRILVEDFHLSVEAAMAAFKISKEMYPAALKALTEEIDNRLGILEMSTATMIKNLMANLGCSSDEAMDILKVSDDLRPAVLKEIENS